MMLRSPDAHTSFFPMPLPHVHGDFAVSVQGPPSLPSMAVKFTSISRQTWVSLLLNKRALRSDGSRLALYSL